MIRVVLVAMCALALLSLSESVCRLMGLFNSSNSEHEQSRGSVLSAQACNEKGICQDVYLALGVIDQAMATELESFFRNNDTNKPLCFLSPGGSNKPAVEISKMIRRLKITTCLASSYIIKGKHASIKNKNGEQLFCASACAYVFISSHKRVSIGSSPTISVHKGMVFLRTCLCKIPIKFIEPKYLAILSIIEETTDAKDRANFYALHEKSIQTPYEEIYHLSNAELMKYNVFTKYE